jgi:multicomponent Na+:H+ antiporter subunit G
MELAGSITILLGSLLFFISALGVIRMPDVYNRIQVGTKATTLGTILVMIGLGLHHPTWIAKLIIMVLFIILTNPISSHIVARAAHSEGDPMSDKTIKDALAEKGED